MSPSSTFNGTYKINNVIDVIGKKKLKSFGEHFNNLNNVAAWLQWLQRLFKAPRRQ